MNPKAADQAAQQRARQRALAEVLREMAQPILPVLPDWQAERAAAAAMGEPGVTLLHHGGGLVSAIPLRNRTICGPVVQIQPHERSLDPGMAAALRCAYAVCGAPFDDGWMSDIYEGRTFQNWIDAPGV